MISIILSKIHLPKSQSSVLMEEKFHSCCRFSAHLFTVIIGWRITQPLGDDFWNCFIQQKWSQLQALFLISSRNFTAFFIKIYFKSQDFLKLQEFLGTLGIALTQFPL